jgi:hypothetical protein
MGDGTGERHGRARTRDPDVGGRRVDGLAPVGDDEKRHTNVARCVIGRPGYENHSLLGSVPEAFERSSLPCRTAPNGAKCDERQSGERSTHVSTLVSAVVLAERDQCAGGEKGEDHQSRDNRKVIKAGLRHEFSPPLGVRNGRPAGSRQRSDRGARPAHRRHDWRRDPPAPPTRRPDDWPMRAGRRPAPRP